MVANDSSNLAGMLDQCGGPTPADVLAERATVLRVCQDAQSPGDALRLLDALGLTAALDALRVERSTTRRAS